MEGIGKGFVFRAIFFAQDTLFFKALKGRIQCLDFQSRITNLLEEVMKLGVSLCNVLLANIHCHVETLVCFFLQIAIGKDLTRIVDQVGNGIVDLFFVTTCTTSSIIRTDCANNTGGSGARVPIIHCRQIFFSVLFSGIAAMRSRALAFMVSSRSGI